MVLLINDFAQHQDQVKHNFNGVKEAMQKGTSPGDRLQKGFIFWLQKHKLMPDQDHWKKSAVKGERFLEILEFAKQKDTNTAKNLKSLFFTQLYMFDTGAGLGVWFLHELKPLLKEEDKKELKAMIEESSKIKEEEKEKKKKDNEKWHKKLFDIEGYTRKHNIMKFITIVIKTILKKQKVFI